MSEMTCKEVVETVTAFLDHKLSRRDRERFATHLDNCPACREYLTQMSETIARLGDLDEDLLTDAMRTRLVEVFHDWRSSSQR